MNYSLKGNLRGFYCGDCFDFLYNTKIRVYAADPKTNLAALAVSREKETFHQRSEDELKSLSDRLLLETMTDESGNFTLELSEKQKYEGGAFDIDFVCGTGWAPSLHRPDPNRPPDLFSFILPPFSHCGKRVKTMKMTGDYLLIGSMQFPINSGAGF